MHQDGRQGRLVAMMAAGSVAVTVLSGLLFRVVPDAALVPFLAGLLLSSVKVSRHSATT